MKRFGLWLGLLAASLAPASAQVSVEVLLDQDQFLPAEALVVAVRVTNRSGQTLRLGAQPDWLTFSIEARESPMVSKIGEAPVQGEFTLESSQMATKRVDIGPYFSFTRAGRYALTATVRIKEWNQEVTSQPKNFYIIEGARLWEQEFGLPQPAGATNAAPEVRKYLLQQANYLRGQLRLYLRLTDATGGRTYRVFPIGPMVSFSRPQPMVDRASNLHVLYQNGPHSFSYTEVNTDGEVTARQTYDYVTSRPRLLEEGEGRVVVFGGTRRVTANDVPPPLRPEETMVTPPPPKPPEDVKPVKP